jgi:fructokinase
MNEDRPVVACFGEILWDSLPHGLFLGGAPLNAAYHLHRQGIRALPISAVGRDFLGHEARRRMAAWGLEIRWVAKPAGVPTGTVQATLDAAGVPRFEIARGVAWDHISLPHSWRRVSPPPDALVFGTLALRGAANRRVLAALLEAWPEAWRVADLNLRPPFDRSEVVAGALRAAQMVKLNDVELARLAGGGARRPDALARAARRFARRHRLARVCVSAGARGAGLWWDDHWYWEPARPVQVRDTVGAGDAFLAGLLAALLRHGSSPPAALAHACRLGEFVAARSGATPPYLCAARGPPRDSLS